MRLTPLRMQGLLNAKSAAGMSPRSLAYVRAVASQALDQAERWGLVSRNVAKLADPPRVPRRPVHVEKITGAAAEAGGTLAEVATVARRVNDRGRSMGLALTSCIVPAAGSPTFHLPDDEVEVGIGIHGEPGRERRKLAAVDEMAEWLVSPIVADLGLSRGDTVLAFVNGMGGTPLIELYVAFASVTRILSGLGIRIGRSLVGDYITSLEMAGFSVTLLRLDDEFVRLWDAPVQTPALRWGM